MREMKTCSKCKHSKPISQYSNEYGETKWCQGCRDQQRGYNHTYDHKTMQDHIRYLLEQEIITKDERAVAVDLLESCDSRISACKYSKPGDRYYGVFCFWDSRLRMVIDIITENPDMWQVWKDTYSYWIEQGCPDNLTPQIDRIVEGEGNNHIGYRLDNIQCLTKEENARKANIQEYYLFNGLEIKKAIGQKEIEEKYDLSKSKINKSLKKTEHFTLSRIDEIKIENKESAKELLPIYEYFKAHELLRMKSDLESKLDDLQKNEKMMNERINNYREKWGMKPKDKEGERDREIEMMIEQMIQHIDSILCNKGISVHNEVQ